MKQNNISRSTDKEREAWFSGWEEFQRLSRSVMEQEEGEEDEDDPVLLAAPPPTYDATADDELVEKKKKKPDCVRGNGSHDSRGRFSTKSNEKSWSKQPHKGSRSDCIHGSRRSRGRWTKVACGRKKLPDGTPDPNGNKADYRCYDAKQVRGKLAREALQSLTPEQGFALVAEVVDLAVKAEPLTEGKQEQLAVTCKQAGFYSLEFFLELQDKLAKSVEGELHGKA